MDPTKSFVVATETVAIAKVWFRLAESAQPGSIKQMITELVGNGPQGFWTSSPFGHMPERAHLYQPIAHPYRPAR